MTSPRVRLYQERLSSASWRVRIALALKGIAYESVWIDLLSGEQRGEAYRSVNPLAQVPCLEIDGRRLAQSVAIVEYLDETRPEPALLPRDPAERARVREIVEAVNAGIQPLHNIAVLERLAAQFDAKADAAVAWCGYWIERRLAELEARLGEGTGRFARGDAVSAADVFLFPQLRKARELGVDVARFPRLAELEKILGELAAFRETAPTR